mgnify:FL=1
MTINFKKESLFEHFKISSNLSKVELNRQFQTKPELRKELPHYIQILNNEQKLFIEELFNTYVDEKFLTIEDYISNEENINNSQKIMAVFINAVRRFDEVITKLKISGKTFDKLLNCIYECNDFSIFKHGNCTNADEIYKSVIECCFSEIQSQIQSILNTLDSKNVNSLYRVISSISLKEIKDRLLNTFINNLGTTLETFTIRKEDKKLLSTSVKFLCGLNDGIFKNKGLYQSYKFCCNKMLNEDISSENMAKLLKRLNVSDLKPIIENFINNSLQFILFENINKFNYEDIVKEAKLAELYVDIIEENDLKIENIDIIKIFILFKEKGEESYIRYQNNVKSIVNKNNLSSAIYNVCIFVYQNPLLLKNKILFTNLILRTTDFETRINNLFSYLNTIEKNAERQYGGNEVYKMSALRSAIISKQKEMLNIILDFYAITIISPELVETFDTIYQLIIDDVDTALDRMKKCDKVRNVNLYHKNATKDSRPSTVNYGRPTSSSGCYIASCVYGSYNCPQVWILRRYRDNHLGSSKFGRLFIKIYYAISPTLVKLFGKTKWFKTIWKKYLDRKIEKLKNAGYESTPYSDKKWQ